MYIIKDYFDGDIIAMTSDLRTAMAICNESGGRIVKTADGAIIFHDVEVPF